MMRGERADDGNETGQCAEDQVKRGVDIMPTMECQQQYLGQGVRKGVLQIL